MPSSLQKLLTARDNERRESTVSTWDRYRDLLQSLHDGEDVAPETASEILDALGKSDDDLAVDVGQLAQRIAWTAAMDRSGKAREESRKIENSVQAYRKQLDDLRDELKPKFEAAEERQRELQTVALQGDQARQRLLETVMDPLLIEDETRLKAELNTKRELIRHHEEYPRDDERWTLERSELMDQIGELEDELDRIQLRKLEA